jgi:hypothetical protein
MSVSRRGSCLRARALAILTELLEFFCDALPFLDKLCRFKMSHQVKCVNCDYSDLRTESLIEFSVTPTTKKQGLITCIGCGRTAPEHSRLDV